MFAIFSELFLIDLKIDLNTLSFLTLRKSFSSKTFRAPKSNTYILFSIDTNEFNESRIIIIISKYSINNRDNNNFSQTVKH